MPAFDGPEMDVLDAWCRKHGLDTLALFKTDAMPTMWRDGERAWWVVRPPAGGEVIIVVETGDAVRHGAFALKLSVSVAAWQGRSRLNRGCVTAVFG